jgi:hypothetical protein
MSLFRTLLESVILIVLLYKTYKPVYDGGNEQSPTTSPAPVIKSEPLIQCH